MEWASLSRIFGLEMPILCLKRLFINFHFYYREMEIHGKDASK